MAMGQGVDVGGGAGCGSRGRGEVDQRTDELIGLVHTYGNIVRFLFGRLYSLIMLIYVIVLLLTIVIV